MLEQQSQPSTTVQPTPFKLECVDPYTTFTDGEPAPIPYVIDGLLTQGGFSILAGKPKSGKSSMSRYQAVCIAKGMPFLGRDTTQGEVLMISLEDPLRHTDNCLHALGYNPQTDAPIRIVSRLSPNISESLEAIGEELAKSPNLRLVIVDTLAKLLRVGDLNEYMPVLKAVEQLRNLAREFPHLHIQGLAHCKKIRTDDPFDSLLGSTALRGEPDTNVALYSEDGQRVIATETRIGRNIDATILRAELVESAGADVVKNFSLDQSLTDWKSTVGEKSERGEKRTHEHRILAFLQGQDAQSAKQAHLLSEVDGNRALLIGAIDRLKLAGVLTTTGVKQSPTNPIVLHVNEDSLRIHEFTQKWKGSVN